MSNKNISEEEKTETVTMTKAQLEAIIDDRIKNQRVPERPKRVTDRIARLRFYEDMPVTSYSNIKEKKDVDNGKLVAWMDITTLAKNGETKKFTVPYLEFLNSGNSVQVQIKKVDIQVQETVEDKFSTVNPNPKDNKNWSSSEIEGAVTRETRTMDILVLEGDHKGEEYTVDSNALNS